MKSSKPLQGKRHIKDTFLSHLCWLSRVTFCEWKATGCPAAGPAYEKRKDCKERYQSTYRSAEPNWKEKPSNGVTTSFSQITHNDSRHGLLEPKAQILLALKNKPCGLNICGLYLGAFCHADDIRTLASSKSDCSHDISSVEDFASSRGLKLSVEKCEAVISPPLEMLPSRYLAKTSASLSQMLPAALVHGGLLTYPAQPGLTLTSRRPKVLFSPEESTSLKGNSTLCLQKYHRVLHHADSAQSLGY